MPTHRRSGSRTRAASRPARPRPRATGRRDRRRPRPMPHRPRTTRRTARQGPRRRSLHDRPPGGSRRAPGGTARAVVAGRSTAVTPITGRSPADHPRVTGDHSPHRARLARAAYDDEPGVADARRSARKSRRRKRGPRQADRPSRGAPAIPAVAAPLDPRRRRRARLEDDDAPDAPGREAAPPGATACRPASRPAGLLDGIPARLPPAARPRGPRDAPEDAPPSRGVPGAAWRWSWPAASSSCVFPAYTGSLRLGAAGRAGLGARAAAGRRVLRAARQLPARLPRRARPGDRLPRWSTAPARPGQPRCPSSPCRRTRSTNLLSAVVLTARSRGRPVRRGGCLVPPLPGAVEPAQQRRAGRGRQGQPRDGEAPDAAHGDR